VNTHTVSTDNGMLRALTNLVDQSNISGTFQSLEGAGEHVSMITYHQMLPAVNVNPGYTVPPITRPRGYLIKQKQQKKIQPVLTVHVPLHK
jgi:hypothetical protein